MSATNYSTIRFIGYVIPTTPGNMVAIGDTNGPGAVAGTYLGNADFKTDIAARISVLKNAVDTAKKQLPPDTAGNGVINLFVAPEFFFHGVQGPYVYGTNDEDPVDAILKQLKNVFTVAAYPNWTFVFGSVITAKVNELRQIFESNSVTVRNAVVESLSKQYLAAYGPLKGVVFDMLVNFIKNCHAYPSLEVRNRALIISNIPLVLPSTTPNIDNMTTEKYFVSNEDFILYDVSGKTDVITEQMTTYPYIDLSDGDSKKTPYDEYAIFRQNYGSGYMDFGIEICLDHSDVRLRRNIENEPFHQKGAGVHIQLIPSCGMQISQPSVAADANGFVFNCDGQYALDGSISQAKQGTLNKVDCIYANYVNDRNSDYAGHTQLARVETPAKGGDPNKKTSSNASFKKLSASDIAIVKVGSVSGIEQYFAGGSGEVHIYGLHTPYILYPR